MTLGNMRQYLLYAIGEILLVMIGILLALQVNNWNQQRINKSMERNYLERFLMDLATDSLCLANNALYVEEKFKGLDIIENVLAKHFVYNQDSIKYAIENGPSLGWKISERRSKATIDEITSSGNLRLISDEEVRVSLVQYYTLWEHNFQRTHARRSGFPNLTYELFGKVEDQGDSKWFKQTLIENNANIEFMKKMRHEYRYAQFIKEETLPSLVDNLEHVKKLIRSHLKSGKL